MGSEYGGTGPRRVPVQPKGISALTNSERILLQNTTLDGVEDPRMPEDLTRAAWQGLESFPKFPPPIYPFPPDVHDDTAPGGR